MQRFSAAAMGVMPSSGQDEACTVVSVLAALKMLSNQLDRPEGLRQVCQATAELLGATAVAVLLGDRTGVRAVADVGLSASFRGAVLRPRRGGLVERLAGGETVALTDPGIELVDQPELAAAVAGLGAMAATPLRHRDGLTGALVAFWRDTSHVTTRLDHDLLDLLAGYGELAISHRSALAEATEGRERLQAVIDGVADGVAVLDGYGLVTEWNQAAALLTGIDAVATVGRPFPFPLGTAEDPLEHQLDSDRWMEVAANPLPEGRGGAVIALRDISRRKALDAAKTLFVAATSHELKTPLTVITSFAGWLQDNVETAPAERRQLALDSIVSAAEELNQIVEKILLTSRTEAGAMDIDLRPVEAGRLVEAIAHQFSVAGRNHQLKLVRPAGLLVIDADPQATRTAVSQLLENAFKYSPQGGDVTLAVADRGDGFAEISVTDEGIGLVPSETEFLFTAFYQGDSQLRSGIKGGVGLGLSIVRRLIEAQGGSVGATGEPGHGARFWVTLPVADLTLIDEL